MPEAEIGELAAHLSAGSAGFRGVWPDNVAAVAAFLAVGTQWRTGIAMADGRIGPLWIGLDYAGCLSALDALGVTVTPALWRGLATMELAARAALNGE